MLKYTLLAESENLDDFDCGETASHAKLNRFLKEKALSHQKEFIGTTILAKYGDNVIGYATLLADTLQVDEEIKNKFRASVTMQNVYSTYPSLKIGRIAVHKDYQHNGREKGLKVGNYLFNLTVATAKILNEKIGIRFITVDSKDISISWYQRLGFRFLYDDDHNFLFYDIMGWKHEEIHT